MQQQSRIVHAFTSSFSMALKGMPAEMNALQILLSTSSRAKATVTPIQQSMNERSGPKAPPEKKGLFLTCLLASGAAEVPSERSASSQQVAWPVAPPAGL